MVIGGNLNGVSKGEGVEVEGRFLVAKRLRLVNVF
jgi:hypothetical protein